MVPNNNNRSAPRGFTLYELVAVMFVMAIIAGTVTFSVRGHVSNARLEYVLDRLETFDARARSEARRLNRPVALEFDSNEQRVSQRNIDGASTSTRRSFESPPGVSMELIKTVTQESDRGVLQIAVSPLGQTDTYAVRLQASSGRSTWFAVFGASGQCQRINEEKDVEEMFSIQRGTFRHDAR